MKYLLAFSLLTWFLSSEMSILMAGGISFWLVGLFRDLLVTRKQLAQANAYIEKIEPDRYKKMLFGYLNETDTSA